MSVRTDTVNLIINVNGNAAQNQLNDLRKRAADLTYEMKNNLKKGTQEYIAAAADLKKVNADMVTLKQSIGITALSQKELTAELNKMKALKGSMTPFTKEFKDMDAQIKAVESRLYDVRNGVTGLASVFSKVGDSVKQFGILAASYLGFQFITSQFQNIIKGAGKLSDQLADLRRVAGLTAEEALNLNSALGKIDTRTSVTALRDIATVAGKLGVAKEDIFGFTKAVDQLVVSLGDELGDADQITTQLGKILNVFDGKINGDNITKLGNAFVELANTGAATGAFIADFDQRLSGIAKSSNIGLGALSGLGAGLEELGSRVESSTTAIQKLIININADIPKAAKIAGVSIDEFNKLLVTDGTEAILKYSEGLVKNKQSFAEVVASLKDAGEEGARVIQTITKLGTGADHLRERIDLGKKSIQENTAITEAFNLKNQTLGATLDKLGKQFYAFVYSSGISTFLKGAVQSISDFIKWIGQLPKLIDDNKAAFYSLIAAVLIYNAALIKSAIVTTALKIETIANAVATKAAAIATALAEAAQAAYITITSLLTGKIKLATAAQRLWNIAMSLGTGAIGILIVAGVALFKILESIYSGYNKLVIQQKAALTLAQQAAQAYGDQVNRLEILKRALESSNVSLDAKKKAYQELIAINPEFAKTLQLDIKGHLDGVEAINEYIAALKEKGNVEAAQNLSNQKNQEILQLQQERYARSLKSDANIGSKGSAAFQYDIAKIDEKIKALQTAKDFFDKKITDALSNSAPAELTLPSDTFVGGKKNTSEDASVAARRAQLQKLIDDSKVAYETLNATDKAGQQANLAQRQKYQDELDALDNKVKQKNAAKYNSLKKDYENFLKELDDLKRKNENGKLDDSDREVQEVQQKYAGLLQRAADFHKKLNTLDSTYDAQTKQLVKEKLDEIEAIRKKYFEKGSEDEYKQSIKASDDYFAAQKRNVERQYAEGTISKTDYENSLTDIEGRAVKNRIGIAKEYSLTAKTAAADVAKFTASQEELITKNLEHQKDLRIAFLQEEANAERDIRNIRINDPSTSPQKRNALIKESAEQDRDAALSKLKEDLKAQGKAYDDASVAMTTQSVAIWAKYNETIKAADDELLKSRIENIANYAAVLANGLDSINQIINNSENRQAAKEQALNAKKTQALKKQLDSKLISQKQYDIAAQKLADDADKKDRKLKHDQAIRQKALDIFSAIINTARAVAEALPNVFLATAIGIMGGLQVAAIATEPLPELGDGGLIKNGPYHKDKEKGLPVINPRTGKTEMLLEKDEGVVKGAAMRDKNKYSVTGTPSQIASKLNSMHGGVNWAGGATLQPAFRKPPMQLNPSLPRIMEQGGIVRPMNQPVSQNFDTSNLERIIENKFDELIGKTPDPLHPLHAVVSIKEYREKEKVYDNARKAAGMNQ